jgi:hypothetical protein
MFAYDIDEQQLKNLKGITKCVSNKEINEKTKKICISEKKKFSVNKR